MNRTPIFVTLALLIGIAVGSMGAAVMLRRDVTGVDSHHQDETVYDRVMKAQAIRCGYVINFPSCYRDPNTSTLRGYSVDCVEEMGRRLDLKIEWVEETTWGTMFEGLSDRYDLIGSTAWRNATRGKVVEFSTPLVYSAVGVYVRPNDHRFDKNLEAINSPSVRIAVMDGELSEVIAGEDFPQAKLVSLPQLSDYSQLLLEVTTQKADVSFMENSVAALFLKTNPNSLKNVATTRPIRVFGEGIMFKLGQVRFKSVVDAAISEMINCGFVDRVLTKYDIAGAGGKYPVALPYQAPQSMTSAE